MVIRYDKWINDGHPKGCENFMLIIYCGNYWELAYKCRNFKLYLVQIIEGFFSHYPIRQRKQHVDYSKTRSRLTVVNNLQVSYLWRGKYYLTW